MKKLVKVCSAIYIILCLGLFIAQDHIIFAAHPYPDSQTYNQGTEHEIPLTKDISMNALLLPAQAGKKSKKVILYLHGNKGNIKRGIYQTRVMKNKGCDIMIIDYRGYGKTEGKPMNDRQMLQDADMAYKYLMEHYDEKDIYVLGYSLGSGMASYIAKMNEPAHLFLVAPFTSLVDIKDKWFWMFPDFILKYKLDNRKHLQDVKCDVTIVHGTDDNVVDYEFSEELSFLYPHIELRTINGGGHRGVIFDSLLADAITQVLRR